MADRSELEALRTHVANQIVSLAALVAEGFDGFHTGAGDYVVELSVPDGPSTGGGAQARQNLRLLPRRKGYSIVVVGTVDPVLASAELRTFDHVAIVHELRHDRPLEITGEEYEEFLAKAEVLLNLARIKGTRVGPPPELLAEQRSRRRGPTVTWLLLGVVMVLAALVVYRVALVLKR